jgi:hypothetical protein
MDLQGVTADWDQQEQLRHFSLIALSLLRSKTWNPYRVKIVVFILSTPQLSLKAASAFASVL